MVDIKKKPVSFSVSLGHYVTASPGESLDQS